MNVAATVGAIAALLLLGIGALHWTLGARRQKPRQQPDDFDLPNVALRIPVGRRKRLFGWWIPAARSRRSVIILHGWSSNAAQLLPLAAPFHRAGYNVLLFDARNHGQSDRNGIASLPAFADDLAHVRQWLKREKTECVEEEYLIGHSVGAGAVLFEAARHPGCNAVISLAAFAHPDLLMRRQLEKHPLPRWLIGPILKYVQWVIGHRFDDIAPVDTIKKVQCPVLIVHGKADRTVPPSDAETIYQSCPESRCQLLLVEKATHGSIEKIEACGEKLVRFFGGQAS